MKTRLGNDYVVEMVRPSPDPTDDEAPDELKVKIVYLNTGDVWVGKLTWDGVDGDIRNATIRDGIIRKGT